MPSRWLIALSLVAIGVAAAVVFGPCSEPEQSARTRSSASGDPTHAAAPAEPRASRTPEPEPARVARLPDGCGNVCDCCASGRDCGQRGCDALLGRDERFGLRVELPKTAADASVRPAIRLCARDPDGGSSQRCAGGANFDVSVEELITTGLEIAIELPVDSETGVFRRPIVLREVIRVQPPTGASLCRGLAFQLPDLPVDKPAIYLEPLGAPAAAACAAR